MASVQCHKTATTYEQKCNSNNSSGLSQKVAEIVSRGSAEHQTTTEAQKHHTSTTGCGHSCLAKPTAQTYCLDNASSHGLKAKGCGVAARCKVKTNKEKGEHKKNKDKSLLKKVKDGLSGNSSCSDSSSDSESDNEGCHKRRN